MRSGRPRRARPLQGILEFLKPCTSVVYGDSYRVVLGKVIEVWSREGRGVTFYELYNKERVLSSKNKLKIVLETLTNCGYLVCRESRARTNSPLGRRDYYPTPLGVLMNSTLSLLDFLEENSPDLLLVTLTYSELSELIENTLYSTVPTVYVATVLFYPQPQLPPYITRGRDTVHYVVSLLLTKILREIVGSPEGFQDPTLRRFFMESVEKDIRETLEYIREKKRWEEYLDWRVKISPQEKPGREEEIFRKALDILERTYKLIMKFVEVHNKTESTS